MRGVEGRGVDRRCCSGEEIGTLEIDEMPFQGSA